MLKKAAHHISRTTLITLEVTGFLTVLLLAAWMGLMWRLSQGPLALNDFVKHRLEAAFSDALPDFRFAVSDVQLLWGGKLEPFEFEMGKVRISRADATPVLAVDRLRVQLSKRNLVFAHIVPTVIKIYGPQLRVIRQEDGRFTLNIGEDAQAPAAAPEAPAADASAVASREELIRELLGQLEQRKGLGLIGGLNEIDISDAAVLYQDRILGVSWLSTRSGITVARGDSGIIATASVGLDAGDDRKAAIRAAIAYGWDTQKTTAAVNFTGINPSSFAQQSEKLKDAAGIDLPFSGSLNMDFDQDFRPSTLRFALRADAGNFNLLDLYPAPVALKDVYVKGVYDVAAAAGQVEQLKIDLGGPMVEASSKFSADGAAKVVDAQATLTGLKADDVGHWWPPALTPLPREWVTKHLSRGVADKATLDIEVAYDPAAEKPVAVRRLGGTIDFHGVRVDYLPPMQPVDDVTGTATYDKSSFNIAARSGKLKDMTASKGEIHITDLDHPDPAEHCKIDIAVAVKGPLKTALGVLDQKPLGYPEKLGIKSDGVSGQADVNLDLKFPIYQGITLSDVKVSATAKLKDVTLPDMVAGMTLSGGPMDLSVDNATLKVKGTASLGGMAATFDWMKSFSKTADVSGKVSASLPLDAAALLKFGVPPEMAPDGVLPASVVYTAAPDRTATLQLQSDLKGFGFAVPQADYTKAKDAAGSLAMTVALKDGKPSRISGLELKTDDASVKGDIDFAPGGAGVAKAELQELHLGGTQAAVTAVNRGRDGYDVKVTGRRLDASAAFAGSDKPLSDAEAARQAPPLRLTVAVQRLVTAKNADGEKGIDSARLYMERNAWKRIERLELDGNAGGKPLSVRYQKQGAGHSLKMDAGNAGEALAALNITKSLRGGHLVVEGRPRPQGGPRDLVGSAVLTGFKINDAPVIAKLLNAMSLSGVIALLNGEGLDFKKARVGFTWTDRGPPSDAQSVRLLKLSDGETAGAALGLTFEGAIDEWKHAYDLKGTIIPVSDVNKLIKNIPIIGTVLTGGEGIIAATYTIKGPTSQPDVMVNPLSVLAPGILRKLFFEN